MSVRETLMRVLAQLGGAICGAGSAGKTAT